MEIRIKLSDSEASSLMRLADQWRVELAEVAHSILRTHSVSFRELRFRPDSELSTQEATEILLHSVYNAEGTYMLIRLGTDPGKDRVRQLADALHVLWFYYRNYDSIPFAISGAAACIVHSNTEARRNSANLHSGIVTQIFDLGVRAFQLLSGAQADADFN